MNRKTLPKIFLGLCIVAVLTSCAAGPNPVSSPDHEAGFLMGLWHGAISLIAFIISLFNENVRVYEVNNTGRWYDLGFLIGMLCIYGGGSASAAK